MKETNREDAMRYAPKVEKTEKESQTNDEQILQMLNVISDQLEDIRAVLCRY